MIRRIRRSGLGRNSETFDKEIQSELRGADFFVLEQEALPTCVHGHAIRNAAEIGGRCICGALLCAACAELRCDLDGRVLCRDHAEQYRGKVVCPNHSFLRGVLHLLT
jgi:hypothetical protein